MDISPPSTEQEAFKKWFTEQGLEYLEDVRFVNRLKGMMLQFFLKVLPKTEKTILGSTSPAPVRIAGIDDKIGYGCFAEENIEPKTFIGIYSGIIKPYAPGNQTTYSYAYPFSKRYEINASVAGNQTRFVNHADETVFYEDKSVINVEARIVNHNNLWKIVFETTAEIPKGRELRVNYGQKYFTYQQKEHSIFHLNDDGNISELEVVVKQNQN